MVDPLAAARENVRCTRKQLDESLSEVRGVCIDDIERFIEAKIALAATLRSPWPPEGGGRS